ncbi:MAG: hypothetical protein CO108_10100 [Deltaproteobacteria bacterium CG_4_9_14_3_um_filter_63_12]|nr:MAG: hypothetical protein CO108_10100 [Deltaproteobacteria bacterium CG_4_9_14_3_um_filter_63_12]
MLSTTLKQHPNCVEAPVTDGPTQFGDYTLGDCLGAGGMAVTYKARESLSGLGERLVAIKQILPERATQEKFHEMFLEEARIASLLSHKNICSVYRSGEIDGVLFMAMEYIDGFSLAELEAMAHEAGRPFPIEAALFIVSELLEGLHAAHTLEDSSGRRLELVHRDVSPQNVLISKKGEVKLIDFGIAKALGRRFQTRTGDIKGKILYLSPEQIEGVKLDARSDLFSVGLMFYELLCAVHPLRGENDVSTIFNFLTKAIPPPSAHRAELDPGLDALVLQALQVDRDHRWPDARVMGDSARDLLGALRPGYRSRDLIDSLSPVLELSGQGLNAFSSTATGLRSGFYTGGGAASLGITGSNVFPRANPRPESSAVLSGGGSGLAALRTETPRKGGRSRWGLLGVGLVIMALGVALAVGAMKWGAGQPQASPPQASAESPVPKPSPPEAASVPPASTPEVAPKVPEANPPTPPEPEPAPNSVEPSLNDADPSAANEPRAFGQVIASAVANAGTREGSPPATVQETEREPVAPQAPPAPKVPAPSAKALARTLQISGDTGSSWLRFEYTALIAEQDALSSYGRSLVMIAAYLSKSQAYYQRGIQPLLPKCKGQTRFFPIGSEQRLIQKQLQSQFKGDFLGLQGDLDTLMDSYDDLVQLSDRLEPYYSSGRVSDGCKLGRELDGEYSSGLETTLSQLSAVLTRLDEVKERSDAQALTWLKRNGDLGVEVQLRLLTQSSSAFFRSQVHQTQDLKSAEKPAFVEASAALRSEIAAFDAFVRQEKGALNMTGVKDILDSFDELSKALASLETSKKAVTYEQLVGLWQLYYLGIALNLHWVESHGQISALPLP